MIDSLAQRYSCTPGQILREPTSMLSLVELAVLAENDKAKKEEAKMKRASKT
jgi:TfoX/Sxy family transcriptional regulator of competence genes